jgi:hypothetical protein
MSAAVSRHITSGTIYESSATPYTSFESGFISVRSWHEFSRRASPNG